MTVLPPRVRADVMERDGYRCPHCGARATTIQHRANKQAGGSKLRDGPGNLLAFCWAFNVSMEASAGDASDAKRFGWKLAQYEDPLVEPFYDVADDAWYLLDDDYGKNRVCNR